MHIYIYITHIYIYISSIHGASHSIQDLWKFTSGTWTRPTSLVTPGRRAGHVAAWDEVAAQLWSLDRNTTGFCPRVPSGVIKHGCYMLLPSDE